MTIIGAVVVSATGRFDFLSCRVPASSWGFFLFFQEPTSHLVQIYVRPGAGPRYIWCRSTYFLVQVHLLPGAGHLSTGVVSHFHQRHLERILKRK